MVRRGTGRMGVALLVVGAALLLSACRSATVIEEPRLEPLLRPVENAVVVQPLRVAPDANINPADVARLHDRIAEALNGRDTLRTYAEPPSSEPDTVVVRGEIERFEPVERTAERLFYRAVYLTIGLSLRAGHENAPSRHTQVRLHWQKAYQAGRRVPSMAFDMEHVTDEAAQLVAQTLMPAPPDEDIPLDTAYDEPLGVSLATARLRRGVMLANGHRYDRAIVLWRLVLLDPTRRQEERLYRVSPRTLALLQEQWVPKATLDKLRPLTGYEPGELLDFRGTLRGALDGVTEVEPVVLDHANHQRDVAMLNLAAAHTNLARLYELRAQRDLAAYHLALAYAVYPTLPRLEEWSSLQVQRRMLAEGLSAEEAISLYLSLPPPRHADALPGPAVATVLPRPAFADRQAEAAGDSGSVGADAAQGGSMSPAGEPVPLEPVPLEPAQDEGASQPGDGGQEGSLRIEQPERVNGG